MPQITQFDSRELRRRLDAGEYLILVDIRENFEREINRIPTKGDDYHIPMGQIPTSLDRLVELAKSGPLVIYCHHGVRSMTVAHWLTYQGVTNLVNLDGGIDAYSNIDSSVPRY